MKIGSIVKPVDAEDAAARFRVTGIHVGGEKINLVLLRAGGKYARRRQYINGAERDLFEDVGT